jgi:hypothetical protein
VIGVGILLLLLFPGRVRYFLYRHLAPASAPVARRLPATAPAPASRGSTNAGAGSAGAPLATLPLAFPVQSPAVAAYFDRIARPEDVAFTPQPYVSLLPQITAGRKGVMFWSWQDARSQLPGLQHQVKLVIYDPEHWPQTPASEQENLVATVRGASQLVHADGLQFAIAPDRAFDQQYLSQLAPYADVVVLQGQRLQGDPGSFTSWTTGMIGVARTANPQVKIYVQVNAVPSTAQMQAALKGVANSVDGVAIWSTPNSLPSLQQYVATARP